MTYLPYVTAAYAVFVLVLVWDFVIPQLQIRRELRRVRLRSQRDSNRAAPAELSR